MAGKALVLLDSDPFAECWMLDACHVRGTDFIAFSPFHTVHASLGAPEKLSSPLGSCS
jgi:hypothetical protein